MIEKTTVKKEEQETVAVIEPITKRATVYSCVPSMVKKLYMMAEHEAVKIELDNQYGIMVSVPQNWIKIRPPVKRSLTEEQKAASAERLKRAKEEKRGGPKDQTP